MIGIRFLNRLFGKQPTRGHAIKGMSPKWLRKDRAANKQAALGLSKNLSNPKFRATEKIMKYKKPRYYG
tara:strand:+ start:73 stop:279 length:207 start_codon:yes stop_codon:yes gene_type:complete